ncbi:hypothetical protein [Paraburkholderia sp. J76]|uniref:hypothetical protein n=1 Tax=Paraburkholderia sp. J76 TaxID=2805439 RepID=UPI002ABE43F6|nr:hypothetical protein [Paraburkholderia sp. J76]
MDYRLVAELNARTQANAMKLLDDAEAIRAQAEALRADSARIARQWWLPYVYLVGVSGGLAVVLVAAVVLARAVTA